MKTDWPPTYARLKCCSAFLLQPACAAPVSTAMATFKVPLALAVILACLVVDAHGDCAVTIRNSCPYDVTACSRSASSSAQRYRLLAGGSTTLDTLCRWPSAMVFASVGGGCNDSILTNSAEFNIGQAGDLDFYDLSNVNAYAMGMQIIPAHAGCKAPVCSIGDIRGFCQPGNQLQSFPSGNLSCHNTDGNLSYSTSNSRQFKAACPDAYSYSFDDANTTFTCPTGTDYQVVFCPIPIQPTGTCSAPGCTITHGIEWWKVLLLVGACILFSLGSCLVLGWRWRVYRRMGQQDVDLIAQLQERETTLMSLTELRRATGNFSDSCQIGAGGFGTVYKGQLEDGTLVAIKRSRREASPEYKHQFLNEVKILTKVHHRNLVKLLGCCLANKTALLVLEYVPNGTLKEHLRPTTLNPPAFLSWRQRLKIALQTADALAYLHSATNPPIYHLDVKSANILLDDNWNAKVADFGISRLAPAEDVSHITAADGIPGTFGYMDPEAFMSTHLSGKSDVYALGVVLLEIITAQAAVDMRRGDGAECSLSSWGTELISKGELGTIVDPLLSDTFQSEIGMESIMSVGDLAARCLRFDSRERPTMREVWSALQVVWDQYELISLGISVVKDIRSDFDSDETPRA